MNCLTISALDKLADCLVEGAGMELHLTPKPGLVDRADCGSHPDLTIDTMERSIQFVSGYLDEMVCSLVAGESLEQQRRIGVQAEQRLLDRLGTNTHKGFIFLSGLWLVARWQAGSSDQASLRAALSALAEEFFRSAQESLTHGRLARERYRAGGIVSESIQGFPSLFEEGLPVFRNAMRQHACLRTSSFAMLARLMQTVEDTTTLHRAGASGLARVKRDGLRLEQMLAAGRDATAYLQELNRNYMDRNITMGGVADMLGLAYGYLLERGEISPGCAFV